MKKSHLVLSAMLIVSILIVGFKTTTQEKQHQYAVVKTIEWPNTNKGRIDIVYPDGQSQRIPVKKEKREGVDDFTIKDTNAINNMGAKGYKLVSSNTMVPQSGVIMSVYIFIKE